DGVLRGMAISEGMQLPLPAIATAHLVDPERAKKMANDMEATIFSVDAQLKGARDSLERNDIEDVLGRAAMNYTLWLLMSNVSERERAIIMNGVPDQSFRQPLLEV